MLGKLVVTPADAKLKGRFLFVAARRRKRHGDELFLHSFRVCQDVFVARSNAHWTPLFPISSWESPLKSFLHPCSLIWLVESRHFRRPLLSRCAQLCIFQL